MSSRSQPRAIPDRAPQTSQPGLGFYNMPHLYSTYSSQAPCLEPSDTVYRSLSPVLSSSVPSRPSLLEVYWSQFGRSRATYLTNDALESSLRVGGSGAAAADHAPYTPSNTGPHSAPLMSPDGDTPQLYVGSDLAFSGSMLPGDHPPPEVKYDSNPLVCGWTGCSSTGTFTRRTSLWRHIRDQHLPPEIICSVCFEPFTRRDKYNTHLRRVHSDDRLR